MPSNRGQAILQMDMDRTQSTQLRKKFHLASDKFIDHYINSVKGWS